MTFKFNFKDFCIFLLLFAIEIFIAKYMNDRFIRPFVGDALFVALMYFFFKTFMQTDNRYLLVGIWVFACVIEILQAFNVIHLLGLENNKIMIIILGAIFDWYDFLAYSAGIGLALLYEYAQNRSVK
jgi:hypothetical protein